MAWSSKSYHIYAYQRWGGGGFGTALLVTKYSKVIVALFKTAARVAGAQFSPDDYSSPHRK